MNISSVLKTGLWLSPFLFGLIAISLGQDANWDLRNYHLYAPYALLNGRLNTDLMPSQIGFFLNPLIDVPFYFLSTLLPAKAVSFVLGSVQGINFVLLFFLARACLPGLPSKDRTVLCLFAAALGMYSGMGFSELGTTLGDYIPGIGALLSALLVVRGLERWNGARALTAAQHAFLSGLPVGIAAGLKLAATSNAIGLCAGLLFPGLPFRRRILVTGAFGAGAATGALLSYGFWGWSLYQRFGNPFFPFFNNIFHSPLAPGIFNDGTFMMPANWGARALFPVLFAAEMRLVNEMDWRDWRIPVLYFLVWAVVLSPWKRGANDAQRSSSPQAGRYLLSAFALSYAAWMGMFCIYRYFMAFEMMAPLLILLALDAFPLRRRVFLLTGGAVLLVLALLVRPADWGRTAAWPRQVTEARIPPIQDAGKTMILMAGSQANAHLLPLFPPEIPFVRIDSRVFKADGTWGMETLIRSRIEKHKGHLLLLIPRETRASARVRKALAHYRLRFSPGACSTVEDLVYAPRFYDLCPVAPLP